MSAEEFENKHVHAIYEVICPHFSATRCQMWPDVKNFLTKLTPGTKIADIGCGNGKYMGANPSCEFFGTDASPGLIDICNDKGYNAVVANALELPYENEEFDVFICIAMLHHLSTEERRISVIREATRILRTGGIGLIYVWSFEHGGQRKGNTIVTQDKQDSMIEWNIPKRYHNHDKIKNGPTKQQGVTNDDILYERYYHMFAEGELERLIGLVDGIRITRSYLSFGNWAVEVKRE